MSISSWRPGMALKGLRGGGSLLRKQRVHWGCTGCAMARARGSPPSLTSPSHAQPSTLAEQPHPRGRGGWVPGAPPQCTQRCSSCSRLSSLRRWAAVCETCSSFFHEFSKNYHWEGRKEKGKCLMMWRLGWGESRVEGEGRGGS